jgi:peroxiredoxin
MPARIYVVGLAAVLGGTSVAAAGDVADLLGTKPPEWTVTAWINSKPLTLESLRGKVVLVRWWTAPGCSYCAASAPALNEFWSRYRDKGLVVIGMYHHKSDAPLTPKHVRNWAGKFGFKFPVAIDTDWKTLQQWWLHGENRDWTSVTFVLDRRGVIRHIHPGGAYGKADPAYDALVQAIETALASPSR